MIFQRFSLSIPKNRAPAAVVLLLAGVSLSLAHVLQVRVDRLVFFEAVLSFLALYAIVISIGPDVDPKARPTSPRSWTSQVLTGLGKGLVTGGILFLLLCVCGYLVLYLAFQGG